MLKNLTFLLFVFCFLTMSCRNENLKGHWHVYGYNDSYSTLDFDGDTTIHLNKYSFDPSQFGSYNTPQHKIKISVECDQISDYTFINKNKLSFSKKVFAEKCNNIDLNHILEDYFSNSIIDVQLPNPLDSSFLKYNLSSRFYYEPIFIGNPKKSIIVCFTKLPLIGVNNIIIKLEELNLWHEQIVAVRPKAVREIIKYAIFADKKTQTKNIQNVITELKKLGIADRRILIACLNSNPTNLENPFSVFHYKNINFENGQKTLQEIIE